MEDYTRVRLPDYWGGRVFQNVETYGLVALTY